MLKSLTHRLRRSVLGGSVALRIVVAVTLVLQPALVRAVDY